MESLPLSAKWTQDILGPDFQRRTFDLGADPDGSLPAIATLVRYCPAESDVDFHKRVAILHIPGTSDYFFQKHVAEYFHSQGYAFYSVDLRKCGRSRQPGQSWHYVSDLGIYFKDLTTVTDEIKNSGHRALVLQPHSMGCLTAALWVDYLAKSDDREFLPYIKAVIMNSPWLDFMFPFITVAIARRLAPIMASRCPEVRIHSKKRDAYVKSLHKDYYGEWDFSLKYKPVGGHAKYWGWVNAVIRSIDRVKSGKISCPVPILTLCAMKSQLNRPYSPESDVCDVVLDVDETIKWAGRLGEQVTIIPIEDARHDVFLSLPRPRTHALHTCGQWLAQQRL